MNWFKAMFGRVSSLPESDGGQSRCESTHEGRPKTDRGSREGPRKSSLIHSAVTDGDLDAVKRCLDQDTGLLNSPGPELQRTPLHCAVAERHAAIVAELIRRKADVNAGSQYGFLPLHLACESGDLEVASLLIGAGADTLAKTELGGDAPLHFAAGSGNLALVQLLLSKDADVNCKTDNGESPLVSAARKGKGDVGVFLIESGADPNVTCSNGWTALHYAAESDCAPLVHCLLEHGADLMARNRSTHTPLSSAAFNGKMQACMVILNYIVQSKKGHDLISEALMWAQTMGHKDVAAALQRSQTAEPAVGSPQSTGMVHVNPRVKLIKKDGTTLCEKDYYRIYRFSEGLAYVEITSDGPCGFIDTRGELVIELDRDVSLSNLWFGRFSSGVAVVERRTGQSLSYGAIDKAGRLVIPFGKYDLLWRFGEGLCSASEDVSREFAEKKWGFVDVEGNMVISPQYHFGSNWGFSEGLAIVSVNNGNCGYINKNNDMVISPRFFSGGWFSDGLANVCYRSVNALYGSVDKTGREVIPAQFQDLGAFSGGLAPCTSDYPSRKRLWGFVDRAGKYVIKPQYEYAWEFLEGLAQVKLQGKIGFINTSGAFVIPPRFTDSRGTGFSDGLCAVVEG